MKRQEELKRKRAILVSRRILTSSKQTQLAADMSLLNAEALAAISKIEEIDAELYLIEDAEGTRKGGFHSLFGHKEEKDDSEFIRDGEVGENAPYSNIPRPD